MHPDCAASCEGSGNSPTRRGESLPDLLGFPQGATPGQLGLSTLEDAIPRFLHAKQPSTGETLEGWRAAAERAAVAEKLLKDAFDGYLNGTAEAPTTVQIAEAKLLRALANIKLQAAMSGIDEERDKK